MIDLNCPECGSVGAGKVRVDTRGHPMRLDDGLQELLATVLVSEKGAVDIFYDCSAPQCFAQWGVVVKDGKVLYTFHFTSAEVVHLREYLRHLDWLQSQPPEEQDPA